MEGGSSVLDSVESALADNVVERAICCDIRDDGVRETSLVFLVKIFEEFAL